MLAFARSLWLDIRLYFANHIISHVPFHFVRLYFYRTILKAKIDAGSSVFMGTWFDTVGGLSIGRNSTVNQQCRLDSRGGLKIGSNVSISAQVYILTADHDLQSAHFDGRKSKVRVADYVFIGTRATILPGVSIGEGAVVAAGAVVTRDVPPYTMVAGIPAKQVGIRRRELVYKVNYRRLLH